MLAAILALLLLPAAQAGPWPGSADANETGAPARAEACFDVASLPDDDREAAENLFLHVLDSEGLYTLAGGIKPASSGFVRFIVDAEAPALEEVDRARRLLERFRCGDLVFATVHHFRRIYARSIDGRKERHYEGIVIAVGPLRRLIQQYAAEFARLGVSPHSHPMEVLMAIEHSDPAPRWRGYGRIFGFPTAAVDFFVQAGELQEKGGHFVKRRFVSLPTYARAERGVVYAVAEDAAETEDDKWLRQAVDAALAEYRQRRERYIGAGKAGAAQLLRDWFCPNGGVCRLPPAPVGQATSGSRK
jgi:hypothetical protein